MVDEGKKKAGAIKSQLPGLGKRKFSNVENVEKEKRRGMALRLNLANYVAPRYMRVYELQA